MKNLKTLMGLGFAEILSEGRATTASGNELLTKYRSYLLEHAVTHTLVNNFLRESQSCSYDNGVAEVASLISQYIQECKVSWGLASICENIQANSSSYNYLNRNAAKQVETLLEQDEADVVRYVKNGALKNVMFVESFRNFIKGVYKDSVRTIKENVEFTTTTPVSITENGTLGVHFVIEGVLYVIDENKNITEGNWNDVSQEFKYLAKLQESKQIKREGDTFIINTHNAEYRILEANKCERISNGKTQTFNLEQLIEHNQMVAGAVPNSFRKNLVPVLESAALVCEKYDDFAEIDATKIIESKTDKLLVLEGEEKFIIRLLESTKNAKWQIRQPIIEAISMANEKTGINLFSIYEDRINEQLEVRSEVEKQQIIESQKNNEIDQRRQRIEYLTEKYKDDPVKLMILSKCAKDLANM